MSNLRALVGACFLMAVMGTIVSVPLGWTIVLLGMGEAYSEEISKNRPLQWNGKLVHKKLPQGTTYEQTRD